MARADRTGTRDDVVYLTPEGLEQLRREREELIHVRRPQILKELSEARSFGDLSENAEYDVAREEQARIENSISQLDYILSNYRIIDTTLTSQEVAIGSTVTLRFLDTGMIATYRIVGTAEADPWSNRISNECLAAKAIMGLKAGATAHINAKIEYDVEVQAIA